MELGRREEFGVELSGVEPGVVSAEERRVRSVEEPEVGFV